MKIWLDTEFNGFGGHLISIGCVAEDGSEFYEVLDCPAPTQWVRENVFQALMKSPITERDLRLKLGDFLNNFGAIEIIAEKDKDIEHFYNAIIIDDIRKSRVPITSTEIIKNNNCKSEIPHNSLEDAKAIMRSQLQEQEQKPKKSKNVEVNFVMKDESHE